MKRLFDFTLALFLLVILGIFYGGLIVFLWSKANRNPLVKIWRTGKLGRVISLWERNDFRANPKIEKWIGYCRLNDFIKLPAIITGKMSFVGPLPESVVLTDSYTPNERDILNVHPGLIDIPMVTFADKRSSVTLRPWVSRFNLLYAAHRTMEIDIKLLWVGFMLIFARYEALDEIEEILEDMRKRGAKIDKDTIKVGAGTKEPFPIELP